MIEAHLLDEGYRPHYHDLETWKERKKKHELSQKQRFKDQIHHSDPKVSTASYPGRMSVQERRQQPGNTI